LGAISVRILKEFTQIFWDFAKVLTDFVQIYTGFSQGFYPAFHQIKTFGGALSPPATPPPIPLVRTRKRESPLAQLLLNALRDISGNIKENLKLTERYDLSVTTFI